MSTINELLRDEPKNPAIMACSPMLITGGGDSAPDAPDNTPPPPDQPPTT